jgi:Flp pilus assembly CpaE family ATPase
MDTNRRRPQIPTGEPELTGQVVAILPAHGGSNADRVSNELSRYLAEKYRLESVLAEFRSHGFPLLGAGAGPPHRFDSQIWGAFLRDHRDSFDTLEAREVTSRNIKRLLDGSRERYSITCADLTEARESTALEVLRNCDSIFLVANSDSLSVEMARHRADWLGSLGLHERSALLLNRIVGGLSGADVEDRCGLPVCAIVEDYDDLDQLAHWLAGPLLPRRVGPVPIRLVG